MVTTKKNNRSLNFSVDERQPSRILFCAHSYKLTVIVLVCVLSTIIFSLFSAELIREKGFMDIEIGSAHVIDIKSLNYNANNLNSVFEGSMLDNNDYFKSISRNPGKTKEFEFMERDVWISLNWTNSFYDSWIA